MNVRTVTNPISPLEKQKVSDSETNVKMNESSQDRDANGQRQQEDQSDQSPLSEEEKKKAEEYLQNLDSLKISGLNYSFETSGEMKFIIIRDSEGNIVRRIPEYEMRSLIGDKSKTTGQIFHKAG